MKQLSLTELRDLAPCKAPAVTAYIKFTGDRMLDYRHAEESLQAAFTKAHAMFPDVDWTAQNTFDAGPFFAARSVTSAWKTAVFVKSEAFEGFYPLRELDFEGVFVGHGLHLKPIEALVHFDQSFTVVWVEEERIRVYDGTVHGLKLVKELTDQEALWVKERFPQQRKSLFAPVTNHSNDDTDSDLKRQVDDFYRRAERIIRRQYVSGKQPTILVGDGRFAAAYLNVNKRRTSFLRVMDTNVEVWDGVGALFSNAMEIVALGQRVSALDRALNYIGLRNVGFAFDSLVHDAGIMAMDEVEALLTRSGVQIRNQLSRMSNHVVAQVGIVDPLGDDLLSVARR